MNKILPLLFILLSFFFLVRYLVIGQAVYGDGIFYWSYTRSLYFDRDLNFFNELGHVYSPKNNNALREDKMQNYNESTEKNYAVNRYPPGAPLSWLPFFTLADLLTQGANIFGIALPRNGYANIYQILVGLGNILFMTIGIYFLYIFLRFFFTSKIALLTTVFFLFATNLFYYGSLDVLNSHPFSFMLSSIFFYVWKATQKKRSIKQWITLGFLIGLLATTRTQDAILGIIPVFELVLQYKNKNVNFVNAVKNAGGFLLGLFIGFLPQLIIWAILYGTYWKSPYLGPRAFDFTKPEIAGVLLNVKTGLLYFSPLYFISFLGLIFYRKKRYETSILFLGVILVQLYVIASWSGWHQGESYGTRMLISLSPALAVGCGYIVHLMLKRLSRVAIVTILFLFVFYNFFMIAVFQFYIQESTYIYGQSTQEMILNKLRSVL